MPAPRARTAPPTANEEALQVFARGTEQTGPLARASEPGIDPHAELRELEDKLDRCLATITMHYQPIVHARTRRRFGYEALLRTSDKSLPHPGAIIDAAERLEKLPKLGRAVRAQIASVFAAEPRERGLVFLNLHPADLEDKQLASAFAPLSKIAHRVILEIAERNSGDGSLSYRVDELRELGFKIALDNMGKGRALDAFMLLGTDYVKVDMSQTRGIDQNPARQRTIRAITDACRGAGTQVIAEGVETEAEAATLIDLGVDLLQGYLIAKPALPFCDPV
jgi:EAL domain-containing protein (putative c-di-GMP-specific phosphodiesterase class I)